MQRLSAILIVALGAAACGSNRPQITRLQTRPTSPTVAIEPGEHPLGLSTKRYRGMLRDGTLYIPRIARIRTPLPLLVLLHGGGGRKENYRHVFPLSEEFGVVMLSLDARDNTWDGVDSPFGPDVVFMDSALKYVFERVAIDPRRIALGGVSDGGFYALSVGMANGDLFTHLVAVAAGYFEHPSPPIGSPRMFLGHGTRDPVYSVASTRDRIVPALRDEGYDVTYYEFDGPHDLPIPVARVALNWFLR